MSTPKFTVEQIADLTLLLAYLTAWPEETSFSEDQQPVYRAWKGYDFEALNRLQEAGMINQENRAKSLYLTKEGLERAKELANKFSDL